MSKGSLRGFTLIELSIVLVVIGLIVGGVLVGRDLVKAAEVRAQISQIERYNTAANAFREKYGYLPGDFKDPDASGFGFSARGQYAGEGDGNGILEAVSADAPNSNLGFLQNTGETVMFWVDLSAARLIGESFNSASEHVFTYVNIGPTSVPSLSSFFPTAKIGNSNYVYVWSAGGIIYFGISTPYLTANQFHTTPSITVQQARAIDTKMDDGLPQSGKVKALYVNWDLFNTNPGFGWAAGGAVAGASPGTVAAPSTTTCYDNGGNASNPMAYSVAQNNGVGVNCALSFRFQ